MLAQRRRAAEFFEVCPRGFYALGVCPQDFGRDVRRSGGRHGGMDYVERWYHGEVKAGRAKPLAIDK